MEKNVIVTDVNGRIIGSTYPKRAKGLVKKGRAEYIDTGQSDARQTIRLKFTHAPAVYIDTEGSDMSKVIDFNAREFRFDESCRSSDGNAVNAGARAYVTMSFGNAEVWEIGDWGWTWSQIRRDLKLAKNTDHVFRFAMEGGVCDTDDAVTIAHIAPKRDYNDRYSFLLDHNKFMPAVCKRDGNGLLRIFELPFNTGEDEEWTITLVAQHAVTRYFAPVNSELIACLPDVTYNDWRNGGRQKKKTDLSKTNGWYDTDDKTSIGVESQEFDEEGFAALLSRVGDDFRFGCENITVHSGPAGGRFSVGESVCGSSFGFDNCTLTSLAMSMILAKLDDGCTVGFENVTVTGEGIEDMPEIGQAADGMSIALENVTMPQKVLDLIYKKMGDGCNISTECCTFE